MLRANKMLKLIASNEKER